MGVDGKVDNYLFQLGNIGSYVIQITVLLDNDANVSADQSGLQRNSGEKCAKKTAARLGNPTGRGSQGCIENPAQIDDGEIDERPPDRRRQPT